MLIFRCPTLLPLRLTTQGWPARVGQPAGIEFRAGRFSNADPQIDQEVRMTDHPIIEAVERALLDVQLRRACAAQRANQHQRFKGWRRRLEALEQKVLLSDHEVIAMEAQP